MATVYFTSLKQKHMSFPRFEIFLDQAGEFRFRLRAKANGEIILASEGYISKQGCQNGIESVNKHCSYDQYYETTNKPDNYRYTLVAMNGRTIGVSEGYTSPQMRDHGIEAVKRDGITKTVEDLT